MPFILRGINLLGINSSATNAPSGSRSGNASRPISLPGISRACASRTIAFADLPHAFQAYIDGKVTGRTVVRIAAQP